MGTPMIKRLLGAGFAVRVWNRTASKLAEVVAAGAVASPTIAEACDGAQSRLHVSVERGCRRAGRVRSAGRRRRRATARHAGRLLDDRPGCDAGVFSARLAVFCGTAWVDAPVSGGPTAPPRASS
mgnify:CR=1 FL=1